MDLLRLPEAARRLGVSYPTLKQWIYRGKIHSIKTAGGHHRIAQSEIDCMLFQAARPAPRRQKRMARERLKGALIETGTGLERFISGRNQLVGRVTRLREEGLLTKVVLDVGGQSVTAIITRDACRDLGLKVGEIAAALIKATEVMILRPFPRRS
jgi:molybdopterin-binding protein